MAIRHGESAFMLRSDGGADERALRREVADCVGISHAARDAERKQAMSYSISTLLTRNLHDVFGENDPARRRAAIDEIYTDDCVFYEAPRPLRPVEANDRSIEYIGEEAGFGVATTSARCSSGPSPRVGKRTAALSEPDSGAPAT